jgi:nitrogen-specific signal transduction histidine kinase
MSEDTPAGLAATPREGQRPAEQEQSREMTLSKLRHEIRNHLNAIKLSCALIVRQTRDAPARATAGEVDRSADRIADLVIRYMNDEEAPKLLLGPPGTGRYDQ